MAMLKRLASSCWGSRGRSRQREAKAAAAAPGGRVVPQNSGAHRELVLLTLLENGMFQWSSAGDLGSRRGLPECLPEQHARVICRLAAVGKLHSPTDPSLALPPHSPESQWLSLKPVTANEAALAAWSVADMPGMQRCLARMADSDPSFLHVLSKVAASVAACQDTAWLQAPRTATYTPSRQLFNGAPPPPLRFAAAGRCTGASSHVLTVDV